MKKERIALLLERFNSAREANREVYFDSDEIIELLDHIENSNKFSIYKEILDLGLRLHPGNTDITMKKSLQLLADNEPESALELIEGLGETGNQEVDFIKIECLFFLTRFNEAFDFFDKLLETHDDEYMEFLFEETAILLNDIEVTEITEKFINVALLKYPENVTLLEEQIEVLQSKGNYKQAIKIVDKLIDQNPYSYDYWYELGRLCSFSGDFERAIEAFDFALTCDESNNDLVLLKAYCLYMNENYEKAIEIYNELLASSGDNEIHLTRISFHIAECYYKMERYQEAFQALHSLFQQDYMWLEESAYVLYTRCCLKIGKAEEAFTTAKKATELFPNNLHFPTLLNGLHLEQKNKKEMRDIAIKVSEILEKMVATENSNRDNSEQVLSFFKKYENNKEEINKALHFFEMAYADNLDSPEYNLVMSLLYYMKGDSDKFNNYYSKMSMEELIRIINNTKLKDVFIEEMNIGDFASSVLNNRLANNFLNDKQNKN